MKMYVVTLRSYNALSDTIVKIFADKSHLSRWLECADQMEKELLVCTMEPNTPISQRYLIREVELDNLDFIELLATAKGLGATLKPAKP